jgi:hypothetical protein
MRKALTVILLLFACALAASAQQAAQVTSPEVLSNGDIVFRIYAPDAHSVRLNCQLESEFGDKFADARRFNDTYDLFWMGIGSADGGYSRMLDMEKYLDGKGIRYEAFHTDGGHNMVNGRKFMGMTIARFFK